MKTDTQLQNDVMTELKWDSSIDATKIGVEVNNGVVTLSFHVENYAQKWAAERAAQKVCGVKTLAVENQITVKPSLSTLSIKSDIQDALKRRTLIDAKEIIVTVNGGNDNLSGVVQSWSERDMVGDSV